ncbi:MAG TPA: S-layer homology domain-containing protein [Acidimicrobiia bacterium]|nr:S-layer homology domain-containing protein [Acidimicrobiia bacterium]
MHTPTRSPGPTVITLLVVALVAALAVPAAPAQAATCDAWVSPSGSDAGAGTNASPWRTLSHAAEAVADAGCTVWFMPGIYSGPQEIERRFQTVTRFRSATPYQAVFEHSSMVVRVNGARNVVIEGFEIRHSGPGSSGTVVNVDEGGGVWAEHITLRNNIIHDSFDNDLLKIHNGVRFATVSGNVFYNQGPNEQHMDVNGVTDVVIEDNIFFNNFAASSRVPPGDTKHYIVVKDSNAAADGLLGAHRITIRRNVFAHWEGGNESIIQVGNDGKPYIEARTVTISDNLFIGDGTDRATSVLGVAGATDVKFVNNTVTGDFPVRAIALRIVRKVDNPMNENVVIANNIFSDPTGTLGAQPGEQSGKFSTGDPASVTGLVLNSNLYWNAGNSIPSGDVISPTDDVGRIVADPGLVADIPAVVPTVWNGNAFGSGAISVRDEFLRIAQRFGVPGSAVASGANPSHASSTDLLGNARSATPSIGAVETAPQVFGNASCPAGAIPSAGFTDISGVSPEARWAINCVAFHGVSQGVGSDLFGPSDLVPRWQMALFLARALDAAGVSVTGPDQGFVDLGGFPGEVVSAVNGLAVLGVAQGVGGDRFDPHAAVSRWQMALFLARALEAAGVSLPAGSSQGFVDLAGFSGDVVSSVNGLATLEIAKGVGGDRFDPFGAVSRWQMALFLARQLAVAGVEP